MQFQAVLANAQHPEYGHTVELLKPLEIGDAVRQDCHIVEVCGDWPTLKQMEESQTNLDELDYLAKRLDSFDAYEKTQFQSMAFRLDLHGVNELINLTFCCQEATVIADFDDLAALGRKHFLTMQGGCAPISEVSSIDGEEIARQLIDCQVGRVTPYGVVYDGHNFPQYRYEDCVMEVEMRPLNAPKDIPGTFLYLPVDPDAD